MTYKDIKKAVAGNDKETGLSKVLLSISIAFFAAYFAATIWGFIEVFTAAASGEVYELIPPFITSEVMSSIAYLFILVNVWRHIKHGMPALHTYTLLLVMTPFVIITSFLWGSAILIEQAWV